jgi:hypothetical protein
MLADYTAHGFAKYAFSAVGVNGLQKGDVLLVNTSAAQHTVLVTGRSGSTVQIVHASGAHGNTASGDQQGNEILTQNYWDDGWQYVLRYGGGATPAPSYADGTFIDYLGTIYVMAGGAPIAVSNWNNVGGVHSFTNVSAAQFNALPVVPRDGTFIDGAGTIYVVAGGAPIAVSDWNHVGGTHPFVNVDNAAITNAGGTGVWSHLNKVPSNGTYIRAGVDIFVIAGGAPIYVSDWNNVGGGHPWTQIDVNAVTNASGTGVWSHLNNRPADGTYLVGYTTGYVYKVTAGAPVKQSTAAPSTAVKVDQTAINNGGGTGVWSHLLKAK